MRRGEIVEELRGKLGMSVDRSTVVNWTEHNQSPYGRVHTFQQVATPELAYVIGVRLGDATLSRGTWQHTYKIKLLVTDREFAEEFSRCAAAILHTKPFKVWWYTKRMAWYTEVGSIMLYRFLKGNLESFKPFVEHCRECAAAFVRGFFDAEGSVGESSLTASNGNYPLLIYVQHLLRKYFQVETSGPHKRGPPPGTRLRIKGTWARVNLQNYVIRVRMDSVGKFEKSVGFMITRKRESLRRLVGLRH